MTADTAPSLHIEGCYSWGPEHYYCAIARIAALEQQLSVLQRDGPAMERGTWGDGSPCIGCMREVMEDYRDAARTEANLRDVFADNAKQYKAERDEARQQLAAARALVELSAACIATFDGEISDEGDPWHYHEMPGVWELAGKPCEECALWNKWRAAIQASQEQK